jgi:hypothetical protein
MMAAETSADLDLVMRTVAAIESEGLQGLDIHYDEFCSPEFEWRPTMAEFGNETYVGQEGYRRYLADILVNVTNLSFRLADIREAGAGRVLVLGHLDFVGRDAVVSEVEYALLCVVDGDRMRACTAYASHAEAEEAAADA